jgi:elongation factor G
MFTGIIDLVSMEKLVYDKKSDAHGETYVREKLQQGDALYEEAMSGRENLIAKIADYDENIAEEILHKDNTMDISADVIVSALRRATISRQFIPVLMGSSFKKIAVQPLMDSIITLLPSPADVIKRNTSYFAGFFCGLAFKVIHHRLLGALTFVRIYSGEVRSLTKVFNVNRDRQETVNKVYIALADEFKEVQSMSAGNIVAITGLECITGDTLVTSAAALMEVRIGNNCDTPIACGNLSDCML